MTEEQRKSTLIEPTRSVLKRIDIGLLTGICAVFVSLMALLVARAQMKSYEQTQKAAVMPVIDIDLGYLYRDDARFFEVTLNNVGAGIASVQSVVPSINGETVEDYQDFEDAVMNRRMRSWSVITERQAAGYLRAGESVTPRSYRFSRTNSEIDDYLRGYYGKPFDGLDITVCYCSVFDDCWTVKYLDRKRPKSVKTCGVEDAPNDLFQNYNEQRADVMAVKKEESE